MCVKQFMFCPGSVSVLQLPGAKQQSVLCVRNPSRNGEWRNTSTALWLFLNLTCMVGWLGFVCSIHCVTVTSWMYKWDVHEKPCHMVEPDKPAIPVQRCFELVIALISREYAWLVYVHVIVHIYIHVCCSAQTGQHEPCKGECCLVYCNRFVGGS